MIRNLWNISILKYRLKMVNCLHDIFEAIYTIFSITCYLPTNVFSVQDRIVHLDNLQIIFLFHMNMNAFDRLIWPFLMKMAKWCWICKILKNMKNTSLAGKGALTHRRTACKIQNGRQRAPKWPTGSGKVPTPRFLGPPANFC